MFKKISYLLEFIRTHLYLSTSALNDQFVEALSKKTDLAQAEVSNLINTILQIQLAENVSDETVLQLNKEIEQFYKKLQ